MTTLHPLVGDSLAPICEYCETALDWADVETFNNAALAADSLELPAVVAGGALLNRNLTWVCPGCQPYYRVCASCGCTATVDCEGGCHWVDELRCSNCPAGPVEHPFPRILPVPPAETTQ